MTDTRVRSSAVLHRPATLYAAELRGLRKSFGQVHAVRDLDLRVAPGEVVALLGPNGAGKTTTLEILLGLIRPDAGEVQLLGQQPVAAVQSGTVGAMLQTGGLLTDPTVAGTVRLIAGLHRHPLRTDKALELAGIADLADRRVGSLSGGQRQRLLFALAVVPDPELLVLDEPTVAMDVESRRAFWVSMRALIERGRSVVFATHYLQEADDNADRIVLMAHGKVVADGASAEIKATVQVRRIQCTLPGADRAALLALPGVRTAEVHGAGIALVCTDADAALRALLASWPAARDLEVRGADLEDAFLTLTS